jgi:hypothetical protein
MAHTITVPTSGKSSIEAPPAAISKLKSEMANAAFRTQLSSDPEAALNTVGIKVDKQTAAAIASQLGGGHGLSPNAIITVTAIA